MLQQKMTFPPDLKTMRAWSRIEKNMKKVELESSSQSGRRNISGCHMMRLERSCFVKFVGNTPI